jgi:Calx-beta domain
MKNNKSPKTLTSRLALILIVSIFNCLVAPLYPGISANVKAANPFDDPTAFVRRISLFTNDIVYSSTTGKIYASLPSTAGSIGNSIATIDPATGAILNTTFIGSEPKNLALSDDGHTLYVWLDGAFAIRRFDTLTNTPGIQFSIGSDQNSNRYGLRDFAVAPGNPNVLAVARGNPGINSGGVAIFDNGVRRANVSALGPNGDGPGSIAFSASATKLYASSFLAFQTITIDSSGATVTSSSTLGSNTSDIQFSNGLIFTGSLQVINPETNTLVGTFTGNNSGTFVADPSVGRVFFMASGPTFSSFSIKAYDTNTFVPLGSIDITGNGGFPLIRWGANGLAVRSFDTLFLIQTSLVPSAEPVPTPTPTPSPTPSPSPSPQAPAFFKRMRLATGDLIYSQSTQKLYASVLSSEGSTGNSVAEIDPVSGSITNQTFVGSEPTQLGQSDDGQTLYVGLDGAASIRSYNILTHTAGPQFIVGRDNITGPYSFTDIAVSPGNPAVIAVARQKRNVFPSEGGVAIFDNGVQRPNTGPEFGGSRSTIFASPSVLYGTAFFGLSTMTVDNSGVTVTGTATFSAGNATYLANGLLYGSTGQVLNPTTGQVVGSFTGDFTGNEIHAVDAANGRVYFLFLGGKLVAYDINTFLPIGFVNVPFVNGTPRDLVRWGTNGLAFRTESRELVLIETALVNASVPVPSPTPTPSPTPVPSPPYIPTFVRRVNQPANNLVFSEATQNLYASVPASAGANGNSITKINPVTAAVGPSVFIGSEPSRMAISNDGQTIWAHLNGANAARRFDVLTETPGLQFTTSSTPPSDMEVVPGSPGSVALAKGLFGGGGVAIYDDGVQRANIGSTTPTVQPIEFGANASVLYGYDPNSFDLVRFLVDSSGINSSTVTKNLVPSSGNSNSLKFLNGLLYTGSGQVVDPEAKTWLGKFVFNEAQLMAVDAPNHRVFYASSTFSNVGGVTIRAFDSNTFLPVGTITVPGIVNTPVSLVRWGVNGLAFNTVPAQFATNEPSRVYLLQTKLVSDAGSIPIGLELEREQIPVFESNTTLPVKVTRTGDDSTAVSVDYATSDGTATAGSDYTATSGTLTFAPGELTKSISIPILDDNVFENGNETFNLTLSNPTNSAVFQTPATSTISIQDSDSKPSLFISSDAGFFVPEGNSGTSNITFRAVLTNPTVQVITVNYATIDGTAVAGSDYVATSGTITIPAGALESSPVNIPINGDTTVEPNELFNLSLSNATNVSFASSSALAIILNDDATVQFTDSAFAVDEGAGFRLINVTRVGDTTRTATVHYATSDNAGLQSCTVSNFFASERCDYGTTAGTLQFAVGETTKAIVIPIVDDAIQDGTEVFTIALSSPTGALLGSPSTATITIFGNDGIPATQNPIDGVSFFVTQQYIDFLGRLPDSIGLANWVDTLGNCPNGGFGEFDNPNCDRVHVSAGFFLSEEFRGRGYFAYKFYEVGLDRRPRYFEFVPDMAEVGGAQSPESEVLSKATYTDAFVQRPEFKNRYDSLSNSLYVDALEINAEVILTNKAALVAALDANQKTRAQVLREIVELPSVNDKFFIRAFVAMQYFGYLRRDPDTIGYNNWVNTLTADPSNFRHMIFGFLFSDEYRKRFGP